MNARRSQRLAFAGLWSVTLAGVLVLGACDPDAPDNQPKHYPASACEEANTIPPYTARYEDGSLVQVPSGAELVAEAQANGDPLNAACLGITAQYEDDLKSGRIVKP